MPDGKLTIRCQATYETMVESKQMQNYVLKHNTPTDFGTLLENVALGDVTLSP